MAEVTSTRMILPFIDGGGAKPIQFSFLEKSDHIPKISVNQRGMISTAALSWYLSSWHQKFERMPVINFKKPSQLTCQRSANSAIFTSIQKIWINKPDLRLHGLPEELRVLKGSYQLLSSDSPPTTPVIKSEGAFVVVRFWLSSRSWHVSQRIRSVSIKQQTRLTSWPITDPRRKHWALSWARIRPEIPLWHPQLPGFSPSLYLTLGLSLTPVTVRLLSDYIYPKLFTRIFNSDGTIPLVGGPDPNNEGPSRRLPPPHWIQLSGKIFWFTKSVTLLDFPHVLNVSISLFQWGQLWIVRISQHINPNNWAM